MTKIAMITPYFQPAVRGNAITVRRISRQILSCGCDVRVFSLDSMCAEEVGRGVHDFRPDLIHAFHGYHGGRVARLAARAQGVPYIVTLTGSDVYDETAFVAGDLQQVLMEAAALVAFDGSMKRKLATRWPELENKVQIIPQGVELPGGAVTPEREFRCRLEGDFFFFLPAGLRPVKNVLMPLSPLAELHRVVPGLRLLLAGPVLDAEYARLVLSRLEEYPFAHYLGEVRHDLVGHLFRHADVVLCTSLFEGGMANSVMEAMTMGKPVLASAIDGNRSLVREEETGLLYGSDEEFQAKAERLLCDPLLRQRLGEAGRRLVESTCSPKTEAAAYAALYREVKEGGKGRSPVFPSEAEGFAAP